jgi:TetR/AcrR family transcriptional regulator, cholesterol catabolism regulator
MARRSQPPESNIARRRAQAEKEGSSAYAARRRDLIEAAARSFAAKGFQGVRMDDVAAEAGTDRATLYYYFANKQQLFRAVIIDAVEANVARAREIAEGDAPADEKLRAMIVALLDSYERHYPYLFVYVQEDMRRIPTDDTLEGRRLAERGREYERALERVIAEGIEAKALRPTASPHLVAYILLGAMNWSHRWFTPEGELSGEQVGQLIADLALDGLKAG